MKKIFLFKLIFFWLFGFINLGLLANELDSCIGSSWNNCFGTYLFSNGDQYKGEWKNNLAHGHGTYTWKNGGFYSGEWKNDKFNGLGTYTDVYGKSKYGIWKDGKYVSTALLDKPNNKLTDELESSNIINLSKKEFDFSNPYNIVILPFKLIGDDLPNQSIEEVIRNNLNRSGFFKATTSGVLGNREITADLLNIFSNKDAVVYGEVREKSANVYDLYFYLQDPVTKKSLYAKKIAVHKSGFRRIAHFLSDRIYEIFTENVGSYDTRLAYVTVTEDKNGIKVYKLQISDSDGFNPQTVIRSSELISSPSWSPDQSKISFIWFKNGKAEVFVATPFEKKPATKLSITEIGVVSSSAPSWHPNGESLLLTLQKGNNQDIYSYNLISKELNRLTSDTSIDQQANFSPDGMNIVFTSNRSGKNQLHIMNLKSRAVYRIPTKNHIGSKSNPVFSPDGEKIAFIQGIDKDKRLALYDIRSNSLSIVTKNSLDSSPSFSPSGEWLIFETKKMDRDILTIFSLPLNQMVELMMRDGNVGEPSWLNYSKKYQGTLNENELFAKLVPGFSVEENLVEKIAKQEELKEKAKEVFAEVKRKSEEKKIAEHSKAQEDEILAQEIAKQVKKSEEKKKAEEAKVREAEEKLKLKEAKELELLAKQAENLAIEAEVEFWNSIKDSNDTDEYQIYLDEYPTGKFVKLAKLRIKKLTIPSPSIPDLNFGKYHALVIGNDKYKHLSHLSNAVNDANDVASILRSKYKFNVNLLTNATRDEIVSALSELRNSISSSDNLLVYYAGHGYLDKAADEGFWLPVDAENDNDVHWVANETIMRSVRAMQAKHVMVVADSCFSGTLTRGIKIKDKSPDYIKKIVQKKARTVLTSGGLEPVSDVGGGNNSVFASSFLNALRDNDGVLDGNQLFSIVRKQVMLNSDQTPEYGDIRKAGHDGGDFIFVSK